MRQLPLTWGNHQNRTLQVCFFVVGQEDTLTNNYYPIYMANNKNKKSSANEEWRYIPLDNPSVVFTTYDLGVSTALLCAGFQLLSVDKADPRKALFIFQKEDGIEDVADRYFSDRLEVKARSFFDHLKALKNKLYSE